MANFKWFCNSCWFRGKPTQLFGSIRVCWSRGFWLLSLRINILYFWFSDCDLTIGPEPETPKEVWTRTIPAYVARASDNPTYNGRYSSRSSLVDDDIVPPALPRQLEKPFLNQNHIQKDDQSVLPNPAHVQPFLVPIPNIPGCLKSSRCSD